MVGNVSLFIVSFAFSVFGLFYRKFAACTSSSNVPQPQISSGSTNYNSFFTYSFLMVNAASLEQNHILMGNEVCFSTASLWFIAKQPLPRNILHP